MKVIPYLYFNGNAKEAIDLYAEAFKGAEVKIMTYGERPEMPEGKEFPDKIIHGEVVFGDNILFISDSVGNHETEVGNNVQINLNCDSEEEILYIYEKLTTGGEIFAPLADTFWGAKFAMLKDKYNIFWSLNYMKTEQR